MATPASVSSGVPQGSILGSLLFILAMNPLTTVSLSINTHILYADNLSAYKLAHKVSPGQSDTAR